MAVRPDTPRSVKVQQVIVVESVRGYGLHPDPVRVVRQYWSLDGVLLAESDPDGQRQEAL